MRIISILQMRELRSETCQDPWLEGAWIVSVSPSVPMSWLSAPSPSTLVVREPTALAGPSLGRKKALLVFQEALHYTAPLKYFLLLQLCLKRQLVHGSKITDVQ